MKIAWLCQYPLSDLKQYGVDTAQESVREATWLRNLALALKDYDPKIQLHIITELASISRDYFFSAHGIHFYVIRSASKIPFIKKGFPNYIPLDAVTGFLLNRYRLNQCVNKIKPDLVHAHGTESVYSIAAKTGRIPFIVSLQGIISRLVYNERHLRYRIICRMERRIIRESKYFIAKTQDTKEFIRNLNPAAVIFDIENPMNKAFFADTTRSLKEPLIVFVGYLIKEKGIEETIKAIKLIPDINLAIIGTGKESYLRHLNQLINSLDLQQRVSLLGHLEPKAIAEIFSRSLILVLPSYMENSPNVVSEAMCAGLPVIATKVGGIPNMVNDGVSGFLIPPKDVDSLKESIEKILKDNKLRESMEKFSREEGRRRYHPSVIALKVMSAYEKIISGNI